MSEFPKKAEGIEINELEDGYVIYHPARDRVHYLNHTAALVLEFCTGGNSRSDIPGLVQAAYELGDVPITEVEDCLSKLAREGLVT
jgi:hypothetical protein